MTLNLKHTVLLAAVLLFSCTEVQRDNPWDEKSKNYNGGVSSSSSFSSARVSSSSSKPSIVKGPSVTYEGETYETVVIGTQTWMARNLNYNAEGSKCYNNDPANCEKYGRLYDWATAMNLEKPLCNNYHCAVGTKHKGICPDGWHIPSEANWDKLLRYVDGVTGLGEYESETAGMYLKATDGWNSGGNGEDWYGFSALPGGSGDDGSFSDVGIYGLWWSATEYNETAAYRRGMSYSIADVYSGGVHKGYFLQSVRCVQD